MKLHALCASAVALTLALAVPAKATTKVNKDFISLGVIAYAVSQKCGASYEFVDGSMRKAADQVGADYDTYAPAVMNAIFAIMDFEYDRTKLIPEVTQQVRADLNYLLDDINKGNRQFCNKYGAVMVNVGFMRKVK